MRRNVTLFFVGLWVNVVLSAFSPLFAGEPVYLSSMRIQPGKPTTHIIFLLNKKTLGHLKIISNPNRVIIELINTRKNFNMHDAHLGNANVQSINTNDLGEGTLQFIFYVTGKVQCSIKFLPSKLDNKVQLQLDITSINTNPSVNTKTSDVKSIPVGTSQPKLKPTTMAHAAIVRLQQTFQDDIQGALDRLDTHPSLPAKNASSPFIVVVDPGHGGRDTGARGQHGIDEKNVVLSIAKKLVKEINQQPHMHAILTRTGDYFVPLRGRLNLARAHDADLFIAIHADAYFDDSATGASVYALSEHGATSEAARWLARRDNYSELGDVDLSNLKDHSLMLRSVLIDLAQTATIQDSLRLGTRVLDALDNISSLHYKQVEQAPFMVLKSPDIPSILVETGFISNPREEQRLANPAYQQKMAQALAQGISQYVLK